MKKILIVNGSKRRNGNSYAMERRVTEQLAGKAEVSVFRLGEKDVRVCLACDGCKRQHTPNCVQKDDFTQPDFSMAGRKDKAGCFFAGFGPVDVYTNLMAANVKNFATAGFTSSRVHVAGDANVPGSILDKPEDLKAADELVEWLLA